MTKHLNNHGPVDPYPHRVNTHADFFESEGGGSSPSERAEIFKHV